MSSPSTSIRPLPAYTEPLGNPGLTLAAASAALLAELESSLGASQRALLARDVAGLEQATREQMRLRRALELLWTRNTTCAPLCDTGPKSAGISEALCDATSVELRAAQRRVLHLGRVQTALLAREQRWLMMLANLIAGPDASYTSPGNRSVMSSTAGRSKLTETACLEIET